MENNMNKEKSITHECNVLTNLFNAIKCAKPKNSHYSPVVKGEKLEIFEFDWTAEAGQQL